MADIRLVIAEDHPLFRDALQRTFEKCGSMQVVAEAQDGPSALEHIRALTPDVALLDIGLPPTQLNPVNHPVHLQSSPVFERINKAGQVVGRAATRER